MEPDFARVILHIDFDAYYTQVEMKRLGIPRETPCAVQQWEGLIAVNYPARARGITRHMRVKEAMKACPELVCVHVETIGNAAEGRGGSDAGGGSDGGAGCGEEAHDRLTQKACLERYRRSTAEVLALLHRLAPDAVIEKASIDEVYMDVTAMVDSELAGRGTRGTDGAPDGCGGDRGGGEAAPASVDGFAWGSIVIGGPLDVFSEFERRLAAGAGIACRLRGALLSELGYTASAGIAASKLLAKIGSAMHKPAQQTLIPPRAVQHVMQDLPLKKLRNFGGKLGEQLEALGCATAGEVQALPTATLAARFGHERAAAIEQAVRGVSAEAVQERERPKSFMAAKSFNPTSDWGALHGWMRVLAQELSARMATDEVEHRRRPKNLVLHYRGGSAKGAPERSKSCAMPRPGGACPDAEAVAAAAMHLFRTKCAAEAMPCSRLAIAAADFADLPAASGGIARFFAARATGGDEGAQQPPPSAQGPQQQQQQQQQAVRPLKAGAGPSITSMFERAQKRQKAAPQGTQREQPQVPGEQQPASKAAGKKGSSAPSIASMFERAQQRRQEQVQGRAGLDEGHTAAEADSSVGAGGTAGNARQSRRQQQQQQRGISAFFSKQ